MDIFLFLFERGKNCPNTSAAALLFFSASSSNTRLVPNIISIGLFPSSFKSLFVSNKI